MEKVLDGTKKRERKKVGGQKKKINSDVEKTNS